jgi:pilus assembly protein CpaB
MAKRLTTALILALCISGLFSLWLSKKFARPAQAAVVVPKIHYVAAIKPLDAGVLVKADDLNMVEWPAGTPLQGAFTSFADVVGRTTLYPEAPGAPLVVASLSAPGAVAGLSPQIPDGMRAISLRSDEVSGVAGYVLPGTHVDVYVTTHVGNSPETTTSMVLQDVQVLTSGQAMRPDPEGKAITSTVVTLLVTPEGAQQLVAATSMGSLHFVLRNGTDHSESAMTASHFGADAAAEPHAYRSPAPFARPSTGSNGYAVQTVAGDKTSTEVFK